MGNHDGYKKLNEDSEDECYDEKILHSGTILRSASSASSPIWILYVSASLCIIGIFCLLTTCMIIVNASDSREALRRLNTYTPLLTTLNAPLHFQTFTTNSSLFNSPFSIYRADPSPEVDEAWEAVSHMSGFPISTSDMALMNRNLSISIKIPESWGYEPDTYLGILNNQHLIHCLDTIRKFAYYDYYFLEKWGPMDKIPPKNAAHRSHCVGVLLDALRCQMSTEVFTYVWMEGQPWPFPDFNVERKCVDHERVLRWQKEKGIPGHLTDRLDLIPRPEGQVEVEGYWQTEALKGWGPNGTFPQ